MKVFLVCHAGDHHSGSSLVVAESEQRALELVQAKCEKEGWVSRYSARATEVDITVEQLQVIDEGAC